MLHYCSPYSAPQKINLHPSELAVSNSHGYVYFIHSKWDYGPTEWPCRFPYQIHFLMHSTVSVFLMRWSVKAIHALRNCWLPRRGVSSCFIMSSPSFAWCFFYFRCWHEMRSQFGGCIQYGSTRSLAHINTPIEDRWNWQALAVVIHFLGEMTVSK